MAPSLTTIDSSPHRRTRSLPGPTLIGVQILRRDQLVQADDSYGVSRFDVSDQRGRTDRSQKCRSPVGACNTVVAPGDQEQLV